MPDVVNPFFAPVVRGAETTARKAGYRVLLCNSEADLRLEREYIEDLIAHRIEGLLIAPATDRSRVSLLALQKSGFPIVLLDRSLPDFDCDSVVSDSVAGARKLVEHLITIGHRRIAHFTESDDVSTGRDRLEGYRQALGGGAAFPIPRSWCSAPPSTASAATARRSRCWRSIRCRPRSSPSTT